MTAFGIAIWIATLIVIFFVIVPVAVSLLSRALTAARSIERYFKDMLDAGVKIAGHTSAIPALNDTLATAAAMKPVADAIEKKTGIVAGVLSKRAQEK